MHAYFQVGRTCVKRHISLRREKRRRGRRDRRVVVGDRGGMDNPGHASGIPVSAHGDGVLRPPVRWRWPSRLSLHLAAMGANWLINQL